MSSRTGRRVLAGLTLVLLAVTAVGLFLGGPPARDRATDLERRLRCPVCKSVSVADSPSATAASMRQVVQEQVAAGRSDEQILAYFRARYGDWVLLDPPRRGRTWLVWALPVAVAVGAVALVATRARPGPAAVPNAPLPPDVRAEVAAAAERLRREAAERRRRGAAEEAQP